MMNKKRVTFSEIINIREIPNKDFESSSIRQYFIDGLQYKIDHANIRIIKIINSLSPYKIIQNGDDIPCKFYSDNKLWYEDTTSIYILDSFIQNRNTLINFMIEFDKMVYKFIKPYTSGCIEYKSLVYKDDVKIKVDTIMRSR